MNIEEIILSVLKDNINIKDTQIAEKLLEEYKEIKTSYKREQLRRKINRIRNDNNLHPKEVILPQKKIDIEEIIHQDKENIDEKKDKKFLKKKYDVAVNQIKKLESLLDLKKSITSEKIKTIKFDLSQDSVNQGVAITLFSDIHFEERVDKRKVNGLNEYNPDIAEQRCINYFKNLRKRIDKERRDIDIDYLIFASLGDMIHGFIHEEYLSSNYLKPLEASFRMYGILLNGLNYLLEDKKLKKIKFIGKVGNHCLRSDTEVLTDKGWIVAQNISDKDVIASFDKSNGNISFDEIESLNKFSEKGGYEISGNFSNEVVTEGHNLVVNNKFIKAKDFETTGQKNFRYAGNFNAKGVSFTDDELKLLTWVVCDGTLVDKRKYNSSGFRVQFKISKQRKLDELQNLLERMEIPFTFKICKKEGLNKLQPYYIRIYGQYAKKICVNWLNMVKEFPTNFATELNESQIKTIIECISITDGRKLKKFIEWSSVKKNNIDIIQTACILNNIPCKYKEGNYGKGAFKNRKHIYVCSIYPNGILKNHKVISKNFKEEETFVAIGSKNGTLITRLDGKVNFTGNSRTTMKCYTSDEALMSNEWSIYKHLEKHFENDNRIDFILDESYFTYMTVYGKVLRFHHGHNIRYMGGVGGLSIPLYKYIYKSNQQIKADMDFIGHYHQYTHLPMALINGSIIGFNAYGVKIGASPEEPVQQFQILDAKRGFTTNTPIITTE